jgi:hypothetical protein
MLILLDGFAEVRKGEASLISTLIARRKFAALETYHLMFYDMPISRIPVFAAVTDSIHPRMLHRVARLPFRLNWPNVRLSLVNDPFTLCPPNLGVVTGEAEPTPQANLSPIVAALYLLMSEIDESKLGVDGIPGMTKHPTATPEEIINMLKRG